MVERSIIKLFVFFACFLLASNWFMFGVDEIRKGDVTGGATILVAVLFLLALGISALLGKKLILPKFPSALLFHECVSASPSSFRKHEGMCSEGNSGFHGVALAQLVLGLRPQPIRG